MNKLTMLLVLTGIGLSSSVFASGGVTSSPETPADSGSSAGSSSSGATGSAGSSSSSVGTDSTPSSSSDSQTNSTSDSQRSLDCKPGSSDCTAPQDNSNSSYKPTPDDKE